MILNHKDRRRCKITNFKNKIQRTPFLFCNRITSPWNDCSVSKIMDHKSTKYIIEFLLLEDESSHISEIINQGELNVTT